jgi:vitamin B12 transporter
LFGTIVDSPGTFFRNEALYGLVRAELSLLDGRWTNALTGQIADTDRKSFDRFGRSGGDKGRRTKGSFESAFRFGTDALAHRITAAVDVERESFRNTSPPSPFVFTGRRHTDNVGIVGQYELTAGDRASFGASVRHDANDRFADITTFRVQGSYRILPETRIRAAYGTGVKNPLYYELFGFSDGRYVGNPNLKPEKSKGWEAGVEQSFTAANTTVGATYFDNRLTDEIFTTFPAPTFIATPGNRTTRSKQHGVEVFASARPSPQLRFDLAYTYLHAREAGLEEVRRPKHIASANVTASTEDQRLSGTLTVRYNGRQDDLAFTDPSFVPVRVSLKSYTLVNLAADYRLTDTLSLFGRVENLLSENYEEVFSFATPGRAAYAGARLRF